MSEQAKKRLAEALAGGGDLDALEALRWALVWSARAAADLAASSDAAVPVEAVFRLDDALTEAARLRPAVDGLVAAAAVGPDAERHMHDRDRELAALGDEIAATRAALDAEAQSAAELRARLAEHAELRAEAAELRRLERLVDVLDEIEAQREAVEARLGELRTRLNGAGTEDALSRSAGQLVTLTEDRLARLAPRVRDAVAKAGALDTELRATERTFADTKGELDQARARMAELRAEHEERLRDLAAHHDADRAITRALAEHGGDEEAERPVLDRVRGLVDDVERRLHDIDAVLRGVLDARARDEGPGRAVVAWREGTTATPSSG